MFIFPKLTGTYAVGTKLFEIVGSTRNDPETGNPRELVVQAWYPTKEKPGVITAPYAYEAREWYKKSFTQQGVEAEKLRLLDGIRTYAITDAPVCSKNIPYPVVIFAHGNNAPRGAYSFFCEEIASHGYVVMMVMHTYITFMTRFADGREINSMRNTKISAVIEECFADIEFMLNQAITGDFGSLTAVCDFNNIGMIGHSLGGIVTDQVCRRDKRVKAGINLDGALWGINATKPFYKPFMIIQTPNFYEDMSGVLEDQKDSLQTVGVTRENFIGSNERLCRANGKDTMLIVVEGANHMTFLDMSILDDFFKKMGEISGEIARESVILPLPTIIDVIKSCIITFFDRQLKKLDVPYPSVVQHDTLQEDFVFYIKDHPPKHSKIKINPDLLDAYVGQYKVGDAVITITKGTNKLWVQVAGQPKYAIYPKSETTFFYTVADRQISFVKDNSGNATKLITYQRGLDQEFKRIG